MKDIDELRAENAALRAELAECTKVQCVQHIAELTAQVERVIRLLLGLTGENQQLSDRAERAEARVAELEGRNKHMDTVLYDAQVLLGTEDIGELITGPTGPISRLIARAERAEAERDALREVLEPIVAWWSMLPRGNYSPSEIQEWLSHLGKATIDKARAALATSQRAQQHDTDSTIPSGRTSSGEPAPERSSPD